MDRRRFVGLIGSALVAPRVLAQGRIHRIGYLASSPPTVNARALEAFRQGLRELGYVEGKNLAIESRWTEDSIAGLPRAAAELLNLNVELIVGWTTPVVLAARKASATVPIVMIGVADPVGSGIVSSLARPGGNTTGTTNLSADLSSKLVELMLEVVPGMRRLAGVRNGQNPSSAQQLKETEAAVRALGLEFRLFDVRAPDGLEALFTGIADARLSGVVFFADPMWISQRERIARLAIKHRLPTAFARVENVQSGGLMSYGPDLTGQFRRAAVFVDRILKGAKPADLPVEQPTTLELALNLKTARAIGLALPQPVLVRADLLIE